MFAEGIHARLHKSGVVTRSLAVKDSLDATFTDGYHAECAQNGIVGFHGEPNHSTTPSVEVGKVSAESGLGDFTSSAPGK